MPTSAAALAERSTARPRILIAEDETLIRLDLRSLFQDRGWEVCAEARNGREAVSLAHDLEPDVALVDVRMPLVDGIEATRQIRARRPTPVVVMTAYDRPSLLARSLVAGANSYVLKPFAAEELVSTITLASADGMSVPGSPRRPVRTPRRAEIVAVAKRRFASQGYEATSIEDIAAEIGLLKGSLYHHISSKEELLVSIVEAFVDASAAVRRHAIATSEGLRRRLEVFVASRRALHAFDGDGSVVLARSRTSLPESTYDTVRKATMADRRFLTDLLRQGRDEGSFRLTGEPADAAGSILDLVAAPLLHGGRGLDGPAVDAAARSCAAFVLAAVGADRSRSVGRVAR